MAVFKEKFSDISFECFVKIFHKGVCINQIYTKSILVHKLSIREMSHTVFRDTAPFFGYFEEFIL